MTQPTDLDTLDKILRTLFHSYSPTNETLAVSQALTEVERYCEEKCREARKQEIELLKETMKLGGDINTKSWMSFDFENYFNDRIKELRGSGDTSPPITEALRGGKHESN